MKDPRMAGLFYEETEVPGSLDNPEVLDEYEPDLDDEPGMEDDEEEEEEDLDNEEDEGLGSPE